MTQVLEIARNAAPKMRPGGTLLLTGGSVRRFTRESGITPAAFAVLPPFTAALALELAPVRVNLIQAAFVDTALAESYFADEAALEARREELRATSPIGRVVEPADVAALAVQLMTNTAVTGATCDVDAASGSSPDTAPAREGSRRKPGSGAVVIAMGPSRTSATLGG
ncbi:MAG TPA: SDR family oxidoreductase [Solirubrobacteraceae bacterium]|nr:SDR family oxidoreductase [Solirubrobacteraceae bacterium]